MSLLEKMRKDMERSGGSKKQMFYVKADSKVRVRFLRDADEGVEVTFHDSFVKGINTICLEMIGEDCPYCGNKELRTRSLYAWPVYNYDANEVQIFLYASNNCSPIPALLAMYEEYGTITDRDFVIKRTGKEQSTSYTLIGQDKVKFTTKCKKAWEDEEIIELIGNAFNEGEGVDDDEDEAPKSKKSKQSGPKPPVKSKAKKVVEEEDEDDEWDDDEDEDDEEEVIDYSEYSAKELYKMCKDRKIKVKEKMKANYYIEKLIEADEDDE